MILSRRSFGLSFLLGTTAFRSAQAAWDNPVLADVELFYL